MAWRELSSQANLSVEAKEWPLYRCWSCSDGVHVSSRSGRGKVHTEEGPWENKAHFTGEGCRRLPSPVKALNHSLTFYSPVKHRLFSLNKSPRRNDSDLNTLSNLPLSSKKEKKKKKTQMSGFHVQLLSMLKRFFLTAVKVWL